MSKIWLIRHSARMALDDYNEWTKTKRYTVNEGNDPLTKNGKRIAKLAGMNLIKKPN